MSRPLPTTERRLALLLLVLALSVSSGCVQTVPLATNSPEVVSMPGRWSGTWRSGAISGNFALTLARAGGDRVTATAVWYGSPTIRRELTGTITDGQLILGDPKTEGLALTAQTRALAGLTLGKGLDLLGPYAVLVDGRPLTGTVDVSKTD
jgi:hypothetical protein